MFKNRKATGIPKLLAMILLMTVTISTILCVRHAFATDESNIFIDLFTQKAPFDGRGINQPSDMFGPQEKVILYALVLFDTIPANGTLVTFDVRGPSNSSIDIEFYQAAKTNSSGIAQTEFVLAVANQTEVFGMWTAKASVQVGGKTYGDTLPFLVNYVVKLISIRTLDQNLTDRRYFGQSGYVGFEVTLENDAMVKKNATLATTVFDELGVAVSSSQIHNLIIPPNGRIQYVYGAQPISTFNVTAVPGNATITAVALDYDNIAYSPMISGSFVISTSGPVFPSFTDGFVYVEAFPLTVQPGETVRIYLDVTNQGTLNLTDFNVSLKRNDSLLKLYFVGSLSSYQSLAFQYDWNTSGFPDGTYIIKAEIPIFPHEADLTDNTYSTTVEITTKKPVVLHDLEVTYVACSKSEVYQGETVNITVVVRNNGNVTESTHVGVYYDRSPIEKKAVSGLLPATEQATTFEWNTTNVPVGTYRIVAAADVVEGEANTANNVYYDGQVEIKLKPVPPIISIATLVSTLFALVLLAATAFLFLLLMLDYLRRRRKKKPITQFKLVGHKV
jgi:hypothetical protein